MAVEQFSWTVLIAAGKLEYGTLEMALQTSIEWTDTTWNPVTGCTKISPGCVRCYAERFAERFRDVPGHPFETGFDLKLRPERLRHPLVWRQPRMVFVNSMSDLFHKEVPDDFVGKVFDTMEEAGHHTFQVLTKRSSRMARFTRRRYAGRSPPANVWLGVSVEDGARKSRIEHLRQASAAVRFLSVEPLVGPVGGLALADIHWVIVGGESGPGYRPMLAEWAEEVRDQCQEQQVAFFFKQWGGNRLEVEGPAVGREGVERVPGPRRSGCRLRRRKARAATRQGLTLPCTAGAGRRSRSTSS